MDFPLVMSEDVRHTSSISKDENDNDYDNDDTNAAVMTWGLRLFHSTFETLNLNLLTTKKADLHASEGYRLLGNGENDRALAQFSKAIYFDATVPRFYIGRAEACLGICDFLLALANYDKAKQLSDEQTIAWEYNDHNAAIYFIIGRIELDKRQYEKARIHFATALTFVDCIHFRIFHLICLCAMGKNNIALAEVNRCINMDGNNCELFVLRAKLHRNFDHFVDEFSDIRSALRINPSHETSVELRRRICERSDEFRQSATTHALNGEQKQAQLDLTDAISIHPEDPSLFFFRGCLLRKQGEHNAALDDFLVSMDLCNSIIHYYHMKQQELLQKEQQSPSISEISEEEVLKILDDSQHQLWCTYNDFAIECFSQRLYDEAIALLSKAISGEKREARFYVNRGDCFREIDELSFALNDYLQAAELQPNDWHTKVRISMVYNEFGMIEFDQGSHVHAETEFRKALSYNSNVCQYHVNLGRALFFQQRLKEALNSVLDGLELDSSHKDGLILLAQVSPGVPLKYLHECRNLERDGNKNTAEIKAAASTTAKKVVETKTSLPIDDLLVSLQTARQPLNILMREVEKRK